MKSVVALLVLAALCNGAIQKDGGLKGSWEDAFSITSTFDNTAPTVDYDGDQPFYYYETTWNITDWDTNEWDWQYVYFAIGDTDRFYYSDAAGFEISLVGGTDGEMVNDPTSCSLYSDLTVSCTFYFYGNTGSYTYAPVITAWDEQGNWASFDETAFADADRTSIQTIIDNTPDMTAPVFVTDSFEITGAEVTLPLSDDYTDLTYVDVSVEVNDNTDSDADTYDMYASDILGVWAVIIDADDIGSEDEADLEWMEALTYDGYSGTTMNKIYGATFGFANWAPLGEWRLRRFEASDRAGNWATAYSVDESITISWDDANEDEVTSCQTLLFNDLSSDLDATGSYASIYFTPGCTVKFSGTNYIWASFASPEYIADGDTVKDSVVVGVTSGYGYTGNTYQNLPLGATSSAAYPGTTFYADGTSTFYLNLYDGQASEEEGEWTLYEMITFTGTGAVQRYTVELGAASSVVPSAVAVVFAAIFAMFRL